MSKRLKSILLKYGITIIVSGLITFLYVNGYKPAESATEVATLTREDLLKALSNGFFLPGVFLTSFGLLFVVSNEGVFDGISWAMGYAIKALIPFGRLKKQKSYAEYKESKKDKQIKGFSFLIVVGAIDIALSILMTILYHA